MCRYLARVKSATTVIREGDMNRFLSIGESIRPHVRHSTPSVIVAEGDSLPLLRKMPDACVSLILTDPPYHVTKKGNIHGDRAFKKDEHYVEWMSEYAVEWRRILRPNGSLFLFCASSMSARLEVMLSERFNVLSHIVWTKLNEPGFDGWKGKMRKESLRQWYPHSERILFAEPSIGNLSPFSVFIKEAREKAGLTMHQLTEITGAYGEVNHGGAVSNLEAGRSVPSREQYEKLCAALQVDGSYDESIRFFGVNSDMQFTDVWTFPSVRPYKGKHPAEKPVEMLEHAIHATTRPGEIVLDCFAGGGNVVRAALKLGRLSISMEIEPKWASRICEIAESKL